MRALVRGELRVPLEHPKRRVGGRHVASLLALISIVLCGHSHRPRAACMTQVTTLAIIVRHGRSLGGFGGALRRVSHMWPCTFRMERKNSMAFASSCVSWWTRSSPCSWAR
jgi:hypothetical protein